MALTKVPGALWKYDRNFSEASHPMAGNYTFYTRSYLVSLVSYPQPRVKHFGVLFDYFLKFDLQTVNFFFFQLKPDKI